MLWQEILKVPFLDHYILIYINDLSDGLSFNTKLFTDGTSLFSVIQDSVITTLELSSDLSRIK